MIKKLNTKKFLKVIIAAFIIFAALFPGVNLYIVKTGGALIKDESALNEKYDCIIVPGAGIYNNSTPSLMLKERLDMAEKLYKDGFSEKIIVSGDHHTKEYDEVNVMKGYLADRGIPPENIFMDHAGLSTYETMYRAKAVFCAEKVLIVTQKYHLFRALYVSKKLGLDANGICADKTVYRGQLYRDLRETAARFKDFIYILLRPQPTFLGETIPVSGNGNITNDK